MRRSDSGEKLLRSLQLQNPPLDELDAFGVGSIAAEEGHAAAFLEVHAGENLRTLGCAGGEEP